MFLRSYFLSTILALTALSPMSALADDKAKDVASPEAKSSSAEELFNKSKCEMMPQKSSEDLWAIAECFKNNAIIVRLSLA